MSTVTRRYTYEDLLHTPDDGNRYEIIDGELIVSPAPRKKHQKLCYRLSRLVGGHVDERDLGEVYFAPVDVSLSGHDVVEPDLLFIRKDRLHIFNDQFVAGPPDLVVEILSPSSRGQDLGKKFALYARAGVPEYWVADPDALDLAIYVLSPQGVYERVEPVAGVLRSTVLPDLVIDLAALFAGLE